VGSRDIRWTSTPRATGIEADKQSAKMTYKGYTGYMPRLGHLAENGLIVGDEFRKSNESLGAGNLEFVTYCVSSNCPEASASGH
jgi:hypothetical protein